MSDEPANESTEPLQTPSSGLQQSTTVSTPRHAEVDENGANANTNSTNTTTTDTGTKDVVKRLESGNRIVSLIKKAEQKRVSKRKIISFLKKKGVHEHKIIEAYSVFYKDEGFYEITFNQRPLGFSVIMDTRGKNAIVSSVQDESNEKLGMKVASRVYEINGKRVDDLKHKEILKILASQATPFYVVFKESLKKSSKFEKHQQKIEQGLQWQTEEEMKEEIEEDEESESDSVSSYDSDDYEAHVHHHYSRKKDAIGSKKKKSKRRGDDYGASGAELFKPHELDQWDEDRLADEKEAMLKQLSSLMLGAVALQDQSMANGGGGGGMHPPGAAMEGSDTDIAQEVQGMSHKRKKTLQTLLTATDASAASTPQQQSAKHEIKKSMTSRKFSVTDLQATMEEDQPEYDPEIFKYLSQLMGGGQAAVGRAEQAPPLTPSTSMMMKELFFDGNQDELQLNAPGAEFGVLTTPSASQGYGLPFFGRQNSNSVMTDLKQDDEEDVIESMEQGTTLLKYGKYGKPKYKTFALTPDHKYLTWFSQKKSAEETRIKVVNIRKIDFGSDSKVVEKTKQTDLHDTSFTIYYGSSKQAKSWKSLTVTAQNAKEAFVWAQGLKILSDAAKQGRHLRTLSKAEIPVQEPSVGDSSGPATFDTVASTTATAIASHGHGGGGGGHQREQSVIISIDKLQKQSTIFSLFSKTSAATVNSLLKQHAKYKQQLQKCVDFVMTKTNYKAIYSAGEFDKVKAKLEELDNRLRSVKEMLTTSNDIEASDLSSVKAELFACCADLDALKQKLTAIVRRPQKL